MKLKFIELAKGETRKVTLTGLDHIIGHEGDIKPEISNGHISRKHVRVNQVNDNCWLISDGIGLPSRNGLYFQDVSSPELKKVDTSVKLDKIGQRVYLLKIDGAEAFIEIFPDVELVIDKPQRQTSGLEIELQKLATQTEKAVDKIQVATVNIAANRNEITELKKTNSILADKVNLALDTIEEVGNNPKKYMMGAATLAGICLLGIMVLGAYNRINDVMDRLLYQQNKIEKKIEQVK